MAVLSFALLTQGDREESLSRAIDSIRHAAPDAEILLLANGAVAPNLGSDIKVLTSPENVGIPGGRNTCLAAAKGEFVFFLDDDAEILDRELVSETVARFEADSSIGVVSFRIVDPESGEVTRRHVPRLGRSDSRRSSFVTTFLGGACAIRKSAVEEVGPYPARFFYGHEESDLGWRLLDGGYRIWYDGDNSIGHPAAEAHRVPGRLAQSVRNRVWLARRRLPLAVMILYLANWTVITAVRARSLDELRELARGLGSGFRDDAGPRSPIKWSTVLYMTRLGRPPVI